MGFLVFSFAFIAFFGLSGQAQGSDLDRSSTSTSKFTRKCNELANSILIGKKINTNKEFETLERQSFRSSFSAGERFKVTAGQFIIGFMRDSDGLIQPVRSDSNQVHSIREIEKMFTGLVRWITDRRMTETPLVEFSGNNLKLDLKSQDYDSLPAQLKDMFASGKILITGNNSDKGKSPYSVLMPVAYQNDGVHEGRTGVLLYNGEPVIVKFSGKEFLVELKGVGTPEGGYGYSNSRRFIRGGIVPGHTDLEFRNIEADRLGNPRFAKGDSVRVGATFSFDSPKGRQSYLIRFTPGSIRASFRENAGLGIPEGNSVLLAKKMGEIWGDFISRGLIPSTHFENLVALNGYQDYIMTDYADIAHIGRHPHRGHNKESTTRDALRVIREMPGYKKTEHFPAFREGLVSSLKKSKKVPDATIREIAELESDEEIGDVLWNDYLRMVYFRYKQKSGWIPDSLKHDIDLDRFDLGYVDDVFKTYKKLNDKLNFRYGNNLYQVFEIERRIEKRRKDLKKQLEELEFMKSHPQKWKDQLMAKESWMSDSQAQTQLESRKKQLESSQQGFDGWIKEKQDDIKNLENENNKIDKKNFFFMRVFENNISGIQADEEDYATMLVCDMTQDLFLLIDHLKKEIAFLEGLETMASKDELAEIQRNLVLAKERYEEFGSMGPYEFHQRVENNPEMLLIAYMLPYYSKNLDVSPDMMEQEQYQRYSQMVLRLIEEGKI